MLLVGAPSSAAPKFTRTKKQTTRATLPTLRKVERLIKRYYYNRGRNEKTREYAAISGLISALNDPYSRFLGPAEFGRLKSNLEGNSMGIGLTFGQRGSKLTVISTHPGSPSEIAGVKTQDMVFQIDNTPVAALSVEEAQAMLQGRKGSSVVLHIRRYASPKTRVIEVRRRSYILKAVSDQAIFLGQIGYIKLSSFTQDNTASQFKSHLIAMHEANVKALVIDLRNNSGGQLSQVVRIASFFIPTGPVLHIIDAKGRRHTRRVTGSPISSTKPLFILVNEGSASAAEMLASAIKENGRGMVLGTPTLA